ncbi:MAG: Sulfotransferase [Frankiales bacterium]|nr:Sulfotransferase [Frankiales bacterium]
MTPLTVDALIGTATSATGLDDLGDLPFLEPLTVLVEALEREAQLDESRRTQVSGTLVGLLVKRLQLVRDRALHPQIAEEVVKAPIIVVGAPRTGSTHLHALLGQDPANRVPLFWEQNLPSPPPERATYDTDPRIAQIEAAVAQMPADLLKRHPVAANRPEQCNLLLDWSFINFALLASYDIPSYRDWLFAADHSPAYDSHRRMLQHLQWRAPGQWVLKYPKHLLALDTLLQTYPDARLVWTHRDPAVVLPSVASLTGYMRSPTPGYDPVRFGREWASLEEMVLRRGLSVRDRLPDPARDHDIHYRDLMRDPIGAIEGVYAQFGMTLSTEAATAMQAWIDSHPQREHGTHRYSAEEFGLSTAGLRRRFSFYSERFGIATEGSA